MPLYSPHRGALAVMPLSLLAAAPLAASPASAGITDPAAIDTAVEGFTGAGIGEVGGARARTDRRLRLAACAAPLALAWHGRGRSTVKVSCGGPEPWRIFIAVRPDPAASRAPAAPLVARGDPITVMVRGAGFTVQQAGEAMESGSEGDWIAIRPAGRGGSRVGSGGADPLRARIVRPGLAVIPAQ